MKRILLFCLFIAFAFAACTDDDTRKEPRIINKPIRPSEIIGVWQNGDYFLSFGEDGYYTAYLPEQYMNFGNYELQRAIREGEYHFSPQDSVIQVHGELPEQYSLMAISHLDSISLQMNLVSPVNIILTMCKTDRKPAVRDSSLAGKEYMGISFINEHRATFEERTLHYFLWGDTLYFGEIADRCISSNINIWRLFFDERGNIASHEILKQ